jgi:putative two-component system response regulator
MPHFHVLVASSGQRALAVARSSPAQGLILLDVMMPVMDGFEVLRQLRSNPLTKSIPVIFVTALSEAEDETQGLGLRAAEAIIQVRAARR